TPASLLISSTFLRTTARRRLIAPLRWRESACRGVRQYRASGLKTRSFDASPLATLTPRLRFLKRCCRDYCHFRSASPLRSSRRTPSRPSTGEPSHQPAANTRSRPSLLL